MIRTSTLENIIAITPVVLMVLFINLGINLNVDWHFKADSFLIVLGNLLIAVYIASVLNQKHKTKELKIANCYKELDCLENYLKVLRRIPLQNPCEHKVNRQTSLINLQIDLISKYNFIKTEHIEKLKSYYVVLDRELTGESNIDNNFKNTILLFEKRILVIKSDIL